MDEIKDDMTVVFAATKTPTPLTSQSPAVRETDAMFVPVEEEMLVSPVLAVAYSPTLPAAVLSFVAVPLMPIVDVGEISALNVWADAHVFAPLRSGTLAPLVPVFWVAAVPRPDTFAAGTFAKPGAVDGPVETIT